MERSRGRRQVRRKSSDGNAPVTREYSWRIEWQLGPQAVGAIRSVSTTGGCAWLQPSWEAGTRGDRLVSDMDSVARCLTVG